MKNRAENRRLCLNCRWYTAALRGGSIGTVEDEFEDYGKCHRYAPRPVSITVEDEFGDAAIQVWPEVRQDDWCGNHDEF